MRSSTLLFYALSSIASANIVFKPVSLSCDKAASGYTGCLRGQVCVNSSKCVWPSERDSDAETSSCVNHDCEPSDSRGELVNSEAIDSRNLDQLQLLRAEEPVLRTSTNVNPSPSAVPPGRCGKAYDNALCGDWQWGSCCSMYGLCGDTLSHCAEGCQSGPCLEAEDIPKPPGPENAPLHPHPGTFEVVGDSGVPVMHAALMPNGKVIFLDKVENYTQLHLANGRYAYSAEYDPETRTVDPLWIKTNPFCSGGSFLGDGSLVAVGGNLPLLEIDPTVQDGIRSIRYMRRSAIDGRFDDTSWEEPGHKLASARWYPSVQTLGDGSLFIAAGSLNGLDPAVFENNNPTYEILDRDGWSEGASYSMDIFENNQPYYMYPFLHLLPDGSLFVFVSKSAELFSVENRKTIRKLPDLHGQYRTYPNTGGSVLLPLKKDNNGNWGPVEVMICGGGEEQWIGSLTDASCGRIRPLDDATWEYESMPDRRGMVEGTLLLDGTILWLNGAHSGSQGFRAAKDPALEALIYDPEKPYGERWTRAGKSEIPRLYHSVALLLQDGTVLVAGSNPNEQPVLEVPADSTEDFVTEFRIEIYTPPYLQDGNSELRPIILDNSLKSGSFLTYGSKFSISFLAAEKSEASDIKIVLYHGGFSTHALHMGQRMIYLDFELYGQNSPDSEGVAAEVQIPENNNLVPPGPYMVFVVAKGIPSIGRWMTVGIRQ